LFARDYLNCLRRLYIVYDSKDKLDWDNTLNIAKMDALKEQFFNVYHFFFFFYAILRIEIEIIREINYFISIISSDAGFLFKRIEILIYSYLYKMRCINVKSWTKDIEINAPINEVWELLNGSHENLQKIMPQVIENKPIKVTEEKVGTIYRQKYKEGKRIEEYDVETLMYLDEPEEKKLKVGFTLAKMFEITAFYELRKIGENKTYFKYTATNRALKWFVKLFLLMASDKVVVKFVERVKRVAEEENNSLQEV
jgi:hypothetical protein